MIEVYVLTDEGMCELAVEPLSTLTLDETSSMCAIVMQGMANTRAIVFSLSF